MLYYYQRQGLHGIFFLFQVNITMDDDLVGEFCF